MKFIKFARDLQLHQKELEKIKLKPIPNKNYIDQEHSQFVEYIDYQHK
jgi:hypothetical protein